MKKNKTKFLEFQEYCKKRLRENEVSDIFKDAFKDIFESMFTAELEKFKRKKLSKHAKRH